MFPVALRRQFIKKEGGLTQFVSNAWADDRIHLYWDTTFRKNHIIIQVRIRKLSWNLISKTLAQALIIKRKSKKKINKRKEEEAEEERRFYQHQIKNKPLSIVMKSLIVKTKSVNLFTRWNNSNLLLKCSRNTSVSAVNKVVQMDSAEFKCKLKLSSIKTLQKLMKFKQGYQSTNHVYSIMLQVNQVRALTTWY